MSLYIQLMKVDYAFGGVVLFAGYPVEPLRHMLDMSAKEAKAAARYTGQDMRFMIWHGDKDTIHPVTETFEKYDKLFTKLGISDTIMRKHIQKGLGHDTSPEGFEKMGEFIDTKTSRNQFIMWNLKTHIEIWYWMKFLKIGRSV